MMIDGLLAAMNPWWSDPGAGVRVPPRRRELFATLHRALVEPGLARAQVLMGPRQVGKTTLLLQLAQRFLEEGWPPASVLYLDFSDPRCPRDLGLGRILEHPSAQLGPDPPRLLLLDEITRSPRWDLALKAAVDRARRMPATRDRILVTDSAASLVRAGAVDALQGRVDEHRIHGLTYRESLRLQAFEEDSESDVELRAPGAFERYLARGGFPEHLAADEHREVWKRIRGDIAEKAIARDLAREGVDVERITPLFGYLAQASGSIFEATKRAADLQRAGEKGTDARTVRKWVDLLEGAFLLASLAPWHAEQGRRGSKAAASLGGRRKLYAEDHGMVPAFSPLLAPLDDPDLLGRVHETAVFSHLRQLAERRGDFRLHYFRRDEALEIDFVLAFQDVVLGVEVSAGRGTPSKLSRVRRAAEAAGADRAILVHGAPLGRGGGERWESTSIRDFLFDPEDCIERNLACARASR